MAQVNYVKAAVLYDPNVSFKSLVASVFNYESLVWNTQPIDKNILEQTWLGFEKNRKITELTNKMTEELQTGFVSAASGTPRFYRTDIQAQIAMIGAYVYTEPDSDNPDGKSFSMLNFDLQTGQMHFEPFEHSHISQLTDDMGYHWKTKVEKLKTKVDYILSINLPDPKDSLDLVYAVTWED